MNIQLNPEIFEVRNAPIPEQRWGTRIIEVVWRATVQGQPRVKVEEEAVAYLVNTSEIGRAVNSRIHRVEKLLVKGLKDAMTTAARHQRLPREGELVYEGLAKENGLGREIVGVKKKYAKRLKRHSDLLTAQVRKSLSIAEYAHLWANLNGLLARNLNPTYTSEIEAYLLENELHISQLDSAFWKSAAQHAHPEWWIS